MQTTGLGLIILYRAMPSSMRPQVETKLSYTMNGQLLYEGTQRRTAKQWTTNRSTLLGHAAQYTFNEVECSYWPTLCHCCPPSLSRTLHSIVTTVCLQGMRFLRIFYDPCSAWYMIRGPWVKLIHCYFIQSRHLPIHHVA